MFVQIEALESDLGQLLSDHVVPYVPEEQAFDPYLEKATQRAADDGLMDPSGGDLVQYLDLGDAIALVNTHKAFLPSESATALGDVNPELNRLCPIRNRVMHPRPLQPSDPDDLDVIVRAVVQSDLRTPRLGSVRQRIEGEPAWSPVNLPQEPASDLRVLHNLPQPDFDETGLIGRRELSEELTRRILEGRHDILTVVGEGGVGKTALAVQVLYDLVEVEDCPFEAILWASLKTESLSGEGVRRIRQASDSVLDLPPVLAEELDPEADPSWDWIAESLQDIPVLLAIDNVETADADEIVRIYEKMPRDVQFLFTSRRGLGQLERRIEVGPLSQRDAARLFRLFARRRNLERLARLPQEQVDRIVDRLRNVPLAIKWYVMSVEAGGQPEDLLHDQQELLDYCVRSVLEQLSDEAVHVAEALFAAAGPLPFTDLAVVVGMAADDLRGALHELQQSALVRVGTEADVTVGQSYSLSDTAVEYFRQVQPPDQSRVNRIRETLEEIRQSEERRLADEKRRSLSPQMVYRRDESDTGAAYLLRRALSASRRQDYDSAQEIVDRAEEIAASYFEVARVRALIHAFNGRVPAATASYERARDMAETEEHRAIVAYYYSGHAARNERDVPKAVELAREAHRTLQQTATALRLGRALTYARQFDDARQHLERAVDEATGKTRLIALTNLVDLWRRVSQQKLTQSHNPKRAAEAALRGLEAGRTALSEGTADVRLNEKMVRSATEAVRALVIGSEHGTMTKQEVQDSLALVTEFVQANLRAWEATKTWSYFTEQLGRLKEHVSSLGLLEEVVDTDESRDTATPEGDLVRGKVKFYRGDEGWGFLTSETGDDVFFHREQLHPDLAPIFLTDELPVLFKVREAERGPEAHAVRANPAANLDEYLSGRHGRVIPESLNPNYAFAKDEKTQEHVFFHRGSLQDPSEWDKLEANTFVKFDVRLGDEGPIAPEGSLTVLN